MLRRIFKRNTTKLDTNSKTFAAAYGLLKTKWLKEQRDAKSLSQAEQNQVSSRQNVELSQLISNYGFDEAQTLRQFPLPTLTDNDLKLELPSYEKELDDAFRKEIGKVIPYLREFTVTGIENYIRRLDRAMLSLAKNSARKEILDKLAAPYLSALISKDSGLIKSYYDRYLLSQDLDETNVNSGYFRSWGLHDER
uniref:ATP synthase assembly factor FMC1, mitochondrial n=1 Tax=Strongyloides papillosus TaxID=174720 RepID=A0A0N5B2Y4_STREA